MKSLLLAAGKGTRLRPLTINTPKCLIKIKDKPLINYWIDQLKINAVEKIYVNTHYLHEKVKKHISSLNEKNINLIYENILLGTAGTLKKNINLFLGDDLLLIQADNYMQDDLSKLIDAHKQRPKSCVMTMLAFTTKTPETCGILTINSKNILQSFIEKPKNSNNNLANGAVYILDKNILNELNKSNRKFFDFSKDIVPNFLNRIYVYKTKNFFIDIGSNETYLEAQDF